MRAHHAALERKADGRTSAQTRKRAQTEFRQVRQVRAPTYVSNRGQHWALRLRACNMWNCGYQDYCLTSTFPTSEGGARTKQQGGGGGARSSVLGRHLCFLCPTAPKTEAGGVGCFCSWTSKNLPDPALQLPPGTHPSILDRVRRLTKSAPGSAIVSYLRIVCCMLS